MLNLQKSCTDALCGVRCANHSFLGGKTP
jgi:hypothetical protein